MVILGIETSCDETGIAIYDKITGLIFEYTYSQEIHRVYGGTVPELASKDHIKKILKILLFTLKVKRILFKDICFISYTIGPGLKTSLFVGIFTAKILSYALKIPAIGINHLKAHIFIAFLFNNSVKFPVLILFVSGAHSFLLDMDRFNNINILNRTLDDSIGETFDKIARSLKLTPANGRSIENMINRKFLFNNLHYPSPIFLFDFSFSGIKSAVIRDISKTKLNKNSVSNISYNFHNMVIKSLCFRCVKLFSFKKYKTFFLSGGVSANKILRLSLKNYCYLFNINFCTQPIQYCTDNGVMIAFFGFVCLNLNIFDDSLILTVKPNLII